jgi:hypothetical protein
MILRWLNAQHQHKIVQLCKLYPCKPAVTFKRFSNNITCLYITQNSTGNFVLALHFLILYSRPTHEASCYSVRTVKNFFTGTVSIIFALNKIALTMQCVEWITNTVYPDAFLSQAMIISCSAIETMLLPKYAWRHFLFIITRPLSCTLSTVSGVPNLSGFGATLTFSCQHATVKDSLLKLDDNLLKVPNEHVPILLRYFCNNL